MTTTGGYTTATVRDTAALLTPRSVTTVTLAGSLERKLAAAARAGFDGIDLCRDDLGDSGMGASQARALIAGYGLQVYAWQPLRDAEGVPPDQMPSSMDRARRFFATARDLGAGTVIVCSNASGAVNDFALTAAQLGDLADAAAEYGLQLAYEALSWGTFVRTYAHAWSLVAAARRDNLGICLDSFHILARGEDLATIRRIPGGKIAAVQVADAPRMNLDFRTWSRHYRCFPRQGDLDVGGFTAAVLAAGYRGPWGLEIFSDELRQEDPATAAAAAMASLGALARGALRGRLTGPGAKSGAGAPLSVAGLVTPGLRAGPVKSKRSASLTLRGDGANGRLAFPGCPLYPLIV